MATLTPCLIRVLIWTSVSSDNLQSDNPFGPRTKSDLFSSYPLSRGEPSVSYETHLAIGTAKDGRVLTSCTPRLQLPEAEVDIRAVAVARPRPRPDGDGT